MENETFILLSRPEFKTPEGAEKGIEPTHIISILCFIGWTLNLAVPHITFISKSRG